GIARTPEQPVPYAAEPAHYAAPGEPPTGGGWQRPEVRGRQDVALRGREQPRAAEHPISLHVLGQRDHEGVRTLNPQPTGGPTAPTHYLQPHLLGRAAAEAAIRAHLSGKHEMAFTTTTGGEGTRFGGGLGRHYSEAAVVMSDPQGRVVAWPKLTEGHSFD